MIYLIIKIEKNNEQKILNFARKPRLAKIHCEQLSPNSLSWGFNSHKSQYEAFHNNSIKYIIKIIDEI
jgi:hypothetical protein